MLLNDLFCVRSSRRYHPHVDFSLDLANSKSQFRRNALYALLGSVSPISTITIITSLILLQRKARLEQKS